MVPVGTCDLLPDGRRRFQPCELNGGGIQALNSARHLSPSTSHVRSDRPVPDAVMPDGSAGLNAVHEIAFRHLGPSSAT